MSRVFKLHGSGPFAGTCAYASIRHLSLFREGAVMEFDPIPYPIDFESPSGEKTFSSLEIDMNSMTPVLSMKNVSTDIFFVELNDIPALWTEWAKWHGMNVEHSENRRKQTEAKYATPICFRDETEIGTGPKCL